MVRITWLSHESHTIKCLSSAGSFARFAQFSYCLLIHLHAVLYQALL